MLQRNEVALGNTKAKAEIARNYCFTLFNADPFDLLDQLEKNANIVKYAIFQEEKTEEGKAHLQGYAELKKPMRIPGVKKIIGEGHYELRRGSRDQARAYCTKTESRLSGPYEHGDWEVTQGFRSELDRVEKMITEKKNLLEVYMENKKTYIKYHQGIQKAIGLENLKGQAWRDVEVYIFYGASGSGKTRLAYEMAADASRQAAAPGSSLCRPPASVAPVAGGAPPAPGHYDHMYKVGHGEKLWWDFYMDEENILLDDYYGSIEYGTFLEILDGYPLRLAVKGAFTFAKWKRVFITSNKHPMDWYEHGYTAAMQRRVTELRYFTAPHGRGTAPLLLARGGGAPPRQDVEQVNDINGIGIVQEDQRMKIIWIGDDDEKDEKAPV